MLDAGELASQKHICKARSESGEMEKECPHCKGTGKIHLSVFAELVATQHVPQAKIAELLGIGQGQVSRLLRAGDSWWRGVNMRTYQNLDRLAAHLGVTRWQLTGDEPLSPAAPRKARPVRKPGARRIAASKGRRAAVAGKNRKR